MKARNFLLCCCFVFGFGFAQTDISSLEYFFDTDPGYGNGTSININPNTANLNQNFVISTGGLSVGTHRLFIRAINTDGTASLFDHKTFRVLPASDNNTSDIVEAEYFFNQDPGVGMGTVIDVVDGALVDETLAISTVSLPAGTHRLYIRTKNTAGVYSMYDHKTFRVGHVFDNNTSDIVEAEYFFNQDPGVGMGTVIDVVDGALVDEILAISTVSLPAGTHRLYIRTKNTAGVYSLYDHKTFRIGHAFETNASSVIAAEYFVDADPGLGNATALSVSGDTIDENLIVTTSVGLSQGDHYLYIRTKNANNEWSVYERQYFEIDGALGVDDDLLVDTIKIYPNPVTETLIISLGQNNNLVGVKVYDLNGRLVFHDVSGGKKLNVSWLDNGMYLLNIETSKGKLSKRIIKQ